MTLTAAEFLEDYYSASLPPELLVATDAPEVDDPDEDDVPDDDELYEHDDPDEIEDVRDNSHTEDDET